MDYSKRHVWITIALTAVLAILLVVNRWKSSDYKPEAAKGRPAPEMPSQAPVSRAAFLGELFKDIRPPEWVGSLLMQEPEKLTKDSLQALLTWAAETGNYPLDAYVSGILAKKDPSEGGITEVARKMIFTGAEVQDNAVVSGYLFQQGKSFIDQGLAMNGRNVPLRNALIAYLSLYESAPMKFLDALKETYAIDSTNVETHYIHLGLLKKSGQWKKALDKCQKLISLQPQNPEWLYQMSNIYGTMGDSVNAKIYLNLAVQVRKKQQE